MQNKNRLTWLFGPGLYCIVPIVLTAVAFYGVWNDSFTNWDDDVYVTGNRLIHTLSWRNILRIFSPATFVCGNYQPLTILSYALNYAVGRLNPAGYILADLLLHLLNVLLVFIFIRKLFKSDFTASLCALLFGIHPMHVESVAWVAGRKDLLCTMFYLATTLWYLSYLEKRTGSAALRYCATCILFVLSLLSKATAVTLPAVLFLIDYCRERKFSVTMLTDKIPFIVPSIILGFWAIKGQHDAGTFAGQGMLSFYSRISIASYSFMFYMLKFIAPLRLSALYPYMVSFSESLPLLYALSPLFAVAAGIAAWYCRRSKAFVFGFGFFLINVIFILHFIPVSSSAVTTDRFTYCAYVGLSFIVAHYIDRGIALSQLKSLKVSVSAAICFVAICFGYAVHERCTVWKNSETLWTDVLGKYPSAIAYNNLGYAYYLNHDYVRAFEDYNTGLLRYPSYADLYNNRGLLYDALGDRARAVEDYDRAIVMKPGFADAYNNRGIDYCENNDYERGVNDFNRAIALDPGFAKAYYNRGNLRNSRGEYVGAIADYSHALSLNPESVDAWYNRGCSYQALNDPDHAIADFNRAIALQPLSPDAYIDRGNAYRATGGYSQAISDFSRALRLVPEPAKYPQVYFNRGLAYRAIGDPEHAREDFMKACAMHLDYACRVLAGGR